MTMAANARLGRTPPNHHWLLEAKEQAAKSENEVDRGERTIHFGHGTFSPGIPELRLLYHAFDALSNIAGAYFRCAFYSITPHSASCSSGGLGDVLPASWCPGSYPASSACAKSAMMSSGCSIPTDTRIISSGMDSSLRFSWVNKTYCDEYGWITNVLLSPRFAR